MSDSKMNITMAKRRKPKVAPAAWWEPVIQQLTDDEAQLFWKVLENPLVGEEKMKEASMRPDFIQKVKKIAKQNVCGGWINE